MSDLPARTEGEHKLDEIWWDTMGELQFIVEEAESVENRIAAADVILRYFISLGQSINAPYIPSDRPDEDEDDEENEVK